MCSKPVLPAIERKQYVVNMQNAMIEEHVWLCCLNCEDYDEHTNTCARFQQSPPIQVIVVGCQYHEERVPF